ncbi:phage tail protein [Enterobacteriaceae bacterium 89]|nr:phage tail protein [Enterobacteriaceae bacterium 89]
MLKPNSLRTALLNAVSQLAATPDNLLLSVASGTVAATLASSLSYEKHYPLTVRVSAFSGDINQLLVPVMAWLRDNQPDILTHQQNGLSWMADSQGEMQNISLTLLLTERTLVTELEGQLHAEDLPEPLPEPPVTRPMELYINGELVSQWQA